MSWQIDGRPGTAARRRQTIRRKKTPWLRERLNELVENQTAGDPMSEQKWVRDSLRQLQVRLDNGVSHTTIGRLLRAMGYGLKANRKQLTGPRHPDREAQFGYIQEQIKRFRQAGWPIISVDSKKKELIGNFKNAGRRWRQQAELVNEHDFQQDALG